MAKNTNMHRAKKNKNDEFYTRLTDIEKECKHYKEQFKGKVIYCNCDDPKLDMDTKEGSKFWYYFYANFNHLGLKKLYATNFSKEGGYGYLYSYDGHEVTQDELKGDGDFRSDESIEILKQSDIVVTNPPFSLFREYVKQLVDYNKQFLIIGNFNAVTYKEIFPLIKDNKLWLGYTSPKEFVEPNGSIKKFGNISWFTNLKVDYRNQEIFLYETYDPKKYPKYDNYDAIEVKKVREIPKDYFGIMGVPITFLSKYNPNQFKILGSQRWAKDKELLDIYTGDVVPPENDKKTLIQGKETYDRIFIKKKDTK